jgi:hypothetical protein
MWVRGRHDSLFAMGPLSVQQRTSDFSNRAKRYACKIFAILTAVVIIRVEQQRNCPAKRKDSTSAARG